MYFVNQTVISLNIMITEMSLRSRIDDLPISMVVVTPMQEPKAVLQLSHGMCGCKERYMPLMEYMAENGVACVASDHRGHGGSIRSIDDLGYMYEGGYLALVDDLRLVSEWAHKMYPDKPLFLLGHSMGSMAARIYTKFDDSGINGLIVSGSPGWDPLSHLGRMLTWVLCTIGLSHYRMQISQRGTSRRYNKKFASEGEQAWICSDPAERQSFFNNPVCNFIMTANGLYNVMSMMSETYRKGRWAVTNSALPIMFLAGDDDPVMRGEKGFHHAAQNICDRGYTNVTSVFYPGMRHEVLNEIGKEDVWLEILQFMGLKSDRA